MKLIDLSARPTRHVLAVMAGVAFSLSAVPAFSESAGGAGGIEEIVVTAQKRSQSIQDVAGAITALTSDQLEAQGLNGVEEIYQLVPNLSYSDYLGSNVISIRGVGLKFVTGVGEAGVATHIDGVFIPRASMSQMEPIDLERIEVLRGPQGTLYGRNANGGVVNYLSKAPTEEFEASVGLGTGSWDRLLLSGFVSGPLSDTVLGRLSVTHQDHGGFLNNIDPTGESKVGDQRNIGVRGSLRFVPSDRLTIDLVASRQDQKYDTYSQSVDLSQPAGVAFIVSPELRTDDPEEVSIPGDPSGYPSGEKETTMVYATVDWAFGEQTSFKSITAYLDHTKGPDGSLSNQLITIGGPSPEANAWIQTSETWTQEFNLSGLAMDGRLDWIVGAYYYEEEVDVEIPIRFVKGFNAITGISGFNYQLIEDIKSMAGFVDLTYSLTDTLRLNVGVRQNRDERDTQHIRSIFITPTFVIPQCNGTGPNGAYERDWNTTNPKVRIEWDVSDDVMLYVSRTEGFKSGGSNPNSCGDRYDPEDVISYEAGIKSVWLDGSLVLNASVYDYDYEGLQFTFNRDPLQGVTTNLENVKMRGLEIELDWFATENLSFDLMLGINDSEIETDLVMFDAISASRGIDDGFKVPDGNAAPYAPDFEASIGVNYHLLTNIGSFRARAEAYHQGDVYYDQFESPWNEGPSYTVGNLYLTYTSPSERVSARAYLKNLTNKHYVNVWFHSTLTGPASVFAKPRHWGLELKYSF